LGKTYLKLL